MEKLNRFAGKTESALFRFMAAVRTKLFSTRPVLFLILQKNRLLRRVFRLKTNLQVFTRILFLKKNLNLFFKAIIIYIIVIRFYMPLHSPPFTNFLLLFYLHQNYLLRFSQILKFFISGSGFRQTLKSCEYCENIAFWHADSLSIIPKGNGFFITIGFEKGIVASSSLLSLFCSYSKIFYSKTFLLPFFSDFIPEENYSPFIQNDFSIQNAKNF